jgi:N-acetyl-anhydromuramyl-L-alanine amidase AmpD
MGSSLRVIVVGAMVSAVFASGAGAASPRQQVVVLRSPNYDVAHRRIDRIVVHVTQEPFSRAIRLLRDPRRGASAHYVVSQRGRIVQLVSTSYIAWHAGNKRMNRRSIGIEHEGWIGRRRSITEAEYRASARLVAYLVTRIGIPIDRRHIIGHDEVPDPLHPGLFGGAYHHRDPGRFWRWEHYMRLISLYARHPERPVYAYPQPATSRTLRR